MIGEKTMLEKCKVVLNNQYVTVIIFGGKEIQIPSIHRKADFVNVLFENGKYMIVDDNYQLKTVDEPAEKPVEESVAKKPAKTTRKRKKTTQENAE